MTVQTRDDDLSWRMAEREQEPLLVLKRPLQATSLQYYLETLQADCWALLYTVYVVKHIQSKASRLVGSGRVQCAPFCPTVGLTYVATVHLVDLWT